MSDLVLENTVHLSAGKFNNNYSVQQKHNLDLEEQEQEQYYNNNNSNLIKQSHNLVKKHKVIHDLEHMHGSMYDFII